MDFHGVPMRRGDFFILPTIMANRHSDRFADPAEVRFDRKNLMQHIAFGSGPHNCLGSHLARRELRSSLERWLERVPPFELAGPVLTHGGTVFGVESLPLRWRPARAGRPLNPARG
jgi:cytochrome P450